ncbi:hypothetical protein CRG98_046408, partial [Punica granatum]
VKDASDKKILVDMLLWAVDNPAPANYLLISGDRDFSNALHQLRMRRYNILLAQPQKASAPLIAAAKSVWLWTSLSAGGSPLSSSELQHLGDTSHISSSETLQVPVFSVSQTHRSGDFAAENPNFHSGNQNFNPGRGIDPSMPSPPAVRPMGPPPPFGIRGGKPKNYSKETWVKIQKFLASSEGQSAMLSSQSRYEAGLVMKQICLKDHLLGDILRILNLLITAKKWIAPDPSGWQPMKITLPDTRNTCSAVQNDDDGSPWE